MVAAAISGDDMDRDDIMTGEQLHIGRPVLIDPWPMAEFDLPCKMLCDTVTRPDITSCERKCERLGLLRCCDVSVRTSLLNMLITSSSFLEALCSHATNIGHRSMHDLPLVVALLVSSLILTYMFRVWNLSLATFQHDMIDHFVILAKSRKYSGQKALRECTADVKKRRQYKRIADAEEHAVLEQLHAWRTIGPRKRPVLSEQPQLRTRKLLASLNALAPVSSEARWST